MIRIFFLLVGLCFLSGCVYANIRTPLDLDLNETELGGKTGATSAAAWPWPTT